MVYYTYFCYFALSSLMILFLKAYKLSQAFGATCLQPFLNFSYIFPFPSLIKVSQKNKIKQIFIRAIQDNSHLQTYIRTIILKRWNIGLYNYMLMDGNTYNTCFYMVLKTHNALLYWPTNWEFLTLFLVVRWHKETAERLPKKQIYFIFHMIWR